MTNNKSTGVSMYRMGRGFTFVLIALMGLAPTGQSARAEDFPAAAELARLQGRRIDGAGPGGSAFDVGPDGSWYAAFLGMPTVDCDGETYRLWFSGGELTSDPSFPYGLVERI